MSKGLYRSGKLSSQELQSVQNAVTTFINENSIDLVTFCDLVHDGQKKTAFWSQFSEVLPMRKDKNIREYMKKAYCPAVMKRPFSEHDYSELSRLVTIHGKSWQKIGRLMNRYREYCQHAYKRWEDRESKTCHGFWNAEEEIRLEQALANYSNSQTIDWADVATLVVTRTPIQCSDHYRARHRDDYTYCKGRKKSLAGQPDAVHRRKPQKLEVDSVTTDPKAVSKPKSLSPVEITDETLVSFVEYLRAKSDTRSIHDLRPSDIGEWSSLVQNVDAVNLLIALTSKYKKIRQWRSLTSKELLRQVEENLHRSICDSKQTNFGLSVEN